jgi:ubiquinol oxidase
MNAVEKYKQTSEPVKRVDLKEEQTRTLATERCAYGFLAKILFWLIDFLYEKPRTLSKFKVLEVIARVPYQSWEHVAYVAMTHTYGKPDFARRIFDFVKESRLQQDNEQWHLFILEEMTEKKKIKENFVMYRFIPQAIAFFYYHISWLLYVIKPDWSYKLNADFEDHAEHEYMAYVEENPDLEKEAFESQFESDYGKFASIGDLFRNIALDERAHKEESLARLKKSRFS